MVYPIARFCFPFIRYLLVKRVVGYENIPKKGPFIIVANHQSHLDGFLLASYVIQRTNQKIHFFAKQEFTGYFGEFIEKNVYKKWAGCLLIEREGIEGMGMGRIGMKRERQKFSRKRHRGSQAIEQASALLDKGGIVGIFPEGTRTYDGSLLEGKTGVVRVILGTHKTGTHKKIPIVPVGIRGADTMLPRSKAMPRIWKSRASIQFGKPFYINYYINLIKRKERNKINKRLLHNAVRFIMNKIAKEAGKRYGY